MAEQEAGQGAGQRTAEPAQPDQAASAQLPAADPEPAADCEPPAPALHAPPDRQGEVVVEGRTLRWYRSPNGVWCVCAYDEQAPACTCGLSMDLAIKQMQWSKELAE